MTTDKAMIDWAVEMLSAAGSLLGEADDPCSKKPPPYVGAFAELARELARRVAALVRAGHLVTDAAVDKAIRGFVFYASHEIATALRAELERLTAEGEGEGAP